jgi:hypothetical protein
VIAGVVAYGLASNDDDDGTATAPAGLGLDDLEPALLTEDDVGRGFTQTDSDGGDELNPDQVDASAGCREVLERFEDSDDDEDLEIDFEGPDEATVTHSLSLVDEDDPSIAEFQEAISRCDRIAWDDGEVRGEFRISTRDLDGPGDAAVGLDFTIEATEGPLTVTGEGYGIFSFRDGVVSAVTGIGGLDVDTFEGLPVDRDHLSDLAERADEKVRRVTRT